MITFYDIPSKLARRAWSPNTWKARYCLNYKNIPYRTEWVEYPDIAPLSQKLRIPPTSTRRDGSPFYTLPAISDPSTGVHIADSMSIAAYLDRAYPDTPTAIPHGTEVLQHTFRRACFGSLKHALGFVLPVEAQLLNPRSEEYFSRTRAKQYGLESLQDLMPTGAKAEEAWKSFERDLGELDRWLKMGPGPFVMGEAVSFADFVLAANMLWLKMTWGEESDRWRDVKGWNEGRWEKVLENMKMYEVVV